MNKKKPITFLVGIDEAGRGALAGPVAVGLVVWATKDWSRVKKILQDYPAGKDSKKLTPKQREFWFTKIEELAARGWIFYQVAMINNKVIDKKGINPAIKRGIKECLKKLKNFKIIQEHPPEHFLVLLDGGLTAPLDWVNQQTIIRGDERELIISLASIVAKVSRDRMMIKLDNKYSQYYFQQHKGYGTKLHYQKIADLGLSVIHRVSYLE